VAVWGLVPLAVTGREAAWPVDSLAWPGDPRELSWSRALDLPSGTVTLMFTDIEGSTRLLSTLGEGYVSALVDHRRIVRDIVTAMGGVEVDTQGDAFFVAFPGASAAVTAAVRIQQGLAAHTWPRGSSLRVRIGIHTGEPSTSGEGYVGLDLHRGARICAAGHGGQVLISSTTRDLLTSRIDGVQIRPLGAQRLKDLDRPMHLFDLMIDGLDNRFPALRSKGAQATNLPPELADLVGRDDLLAAGDDYLRDRSHRLVTLTGPGGTGKTALALRLAANLLPDLADGAFVVWLAPVERSESVAEAIAGALNLGERPGFSFAEVLTTYLAEREMMLVCDNFEHVANAAPLLDDLLRAAPRLRILVTSRTPLRIAGELDVPVPPLDVGASSSPIGDGAPPAVELFLRRARAAKPNLQVEAAAMAAIAEICRRLDGLPLAIELTAARIRLMSPEAMLTRMADPLELASGGSRHAASRQQALRSTIDWSFDLLSDLQQRTFVRLGVFVGTFTIEAAERVCDADLNELAELLDHSLLRSFDEQGGASRLGMLETVRVYARERLQVTAEYAEVRDRHAAWCADLVSAGGPELLSGKHELYLAQFDAEGNELRAAFDWLIESGHADTALKFAADLAVFCDTRGQWTEARLQLERALAVATPAAVADRSRALFSLGRLALNQGQMDRAIAALDEALDSFRTVGDARAITLCLSHLGLALAGSDPQESVALHDAALVVARASGDSWTIAVGLNNLGNDLLEIGAEFPRARDALEECLRLRRELGEKRTLAITLSNIGRLSLLEGRRDDAKVALEEALALALDLGYEVIVSEARYTLARIARDEGDLERARSLLVDALDRVERLGDPGLRAACLEQLEQIAQLTKDGA
jgi:predicted ATPase/class 3 adenylate cyclase